MLPFTKKQKLLMAAGVALLFGFFTWVQLIRDEPERFPPGFTLPAPLPKVPEKDNGLAHLVLTYESKGSWPEGNTKDQYDILRGAMPWDAGVMQPLLDAAPAARQMVEEALEKPFWQDAVLNNGRILSAASELGTLQRILRAKPMDLVRQGDSAQAVNWISLAQRLNARQIAGARTFDSVDSGAVGSVRLNILLFSMLTAPAVTDSFLSAAMDILGHCPLDRGQFQRVLAEEFRERRSLFPHSKYEPTGTAALSSLFYMCCGSSVPAWVANTRFKPQAACNRLARHYAFVHGIALREGAPFRKAGNDARALAESDGQLPLWSLEPNRAGKILAANSLHAWLLTERLVVCRDSLRRCQLTAVAARRWSLAHGGNRPAAVTELVPDFLPSVPMDPYDGQPVKWDAATGTAYVIGEDGVDDLPAIPAGQFFLYRPDGSAARLP